MICDTVKVNHLRLYVIRPEIGGSRLTSVSGSVYSSQ